MVKLGIKTAKHNFLTIYIKESKKPVLIKFMELIQDDESMLILADKKNPKNILSVSVVEALHRYNLKRIAELKSKSNETSN
jgi:hypothetical protein